MDRLQPARTGAARRPRGARAAPTAVLKPLKLVLDNYPVGQTEDAPLPVHPQHPELGTRTIQLARELWIEADDFMESASCRLLPARARQGRQPPGNRCGPRHALRESTRDAVSTRTQRAKLPLFTPNICRKPRAAHPARTASRPRTAIHRLPGACQHPCRSARVRSTVHRPAPRCRAKATSPALINKNSKQILRAFVEPSLANAKSDDQVPVRENRVLRGGSRRSHGNEPSIQSCCVATGFCDSTEVKGAAAIAVAAEAVWKPFGCRPYAIDDALVIVVS